MGLMGEDVLVDIAEEMLEVSKKRFAGLETFSVIAAVK